ncbi:hypothetical protein [Nocardia nova]
MEVPTLEALCRYRRRTVPLEFLVGWIEGLTVVHNCARIQFAEFARLQLYNSALTVLDLYENFISANRYGSRSEHQTEKPTGRVFFEQSCDLLQQVALTDYQALDLTCHENTPSSAASDLGGH